MRSFSDPQESRNANVYSVVLITNPGEGKGHQRAACLLNSAGHFLSHCLGPVISHAAFRIAFHTFEAPLSTVSLKDGEWCNRQIGVTFLFLYFVVHWPLTFDPDHTMGTHLGAPTHPRVWCYEGVP